MPRHGQVLSSASTSSRAGLVNWLYREHLFKATVFILIMLLVLQYGVNVFVAGRYYYVSDFLSKYVAKDLQWRNRTNSARKLLSESALRRQRKNNNSSNVVLDDSVVASAQRVSIIPAVDQVPIRLVLPNLAMVSAKPSADRFNRHKGRQFVTSRVTSRTPQPDPLYDNDKGLSNALLESSEQLAHKQLSGDKNLKYASQKGLHTDYGKTRKTVGRLKSSRYTKKPSGLTIAKQITPLKKKKVPTATLR